VSAAVAALRHRLTTGLAETPSAFVVLAQRDSVRSMPASAGRHARRRVRPNRYPGRLPVRDAGPTDLSRRGENATCHRLGKDLIHRRHNSAQLSRHDGAAIERHEPKGHAMTYVIKTRRLPEPAMVIAIEPKGEIKTDEAADLFRARFGMVLAATQPQRIVVDLSDVPSMSEAGLEALQSGRDKAAADDASVVVVHPAPQVCEQLRRHGLGELVEGTARA
jgi:anti-anti-sigma factor